MTQVNCMLLGEHLASVIMFL